MTTPPLHPALDVSRLCRAAIEDAPLPMALVDATSHLVLMANTAFCRLVNTSEDGLVGKPLADELGGTQGYRALLERVSRTGKAASYTVREQADGRTVFWAHTIWPLKIDEHTVGLVVQLSDATKSHELTVAMNEALVLGSVHQHELADVAAAANARLQEEVEARKGLERSLREAQSILSDRAGQLTAQVADRTAELTAMNQQLETFVYTIAHHLRAPLRSLQGFSELLRDDTATHLSESAQRFAERIDRSAQSMDAMLGDLLAFSRVSQHRVPLASVGMKAIVESVLSRLQKDIDEKKAGVDAGGPWPAVLAHEATLTQVLFNLVDNALKFARPGIPPRVRLRTEESPGFIRVWIEDNGIGIARAHQSQIFDLFTRLDGDSHAGTGVGLSIVQKAVERMGGRVGLDSSPGQGTRFWVELKKA